MDRLSLSFPVERLRWSAAAWDSLTIARGECRKVSARVDVDGSAVFFGAAEIDQADGSRPLFGKVEFNPSRVGDPDGVGLVGASGVLERLEPVLEVLAGSYLTPTTDLAQWRVKRLDAARDFRGVNDKPALLSALATVHRPWSRRNTLYNDGKRAGAQTLMVGSGAGVLRAYDKHAENERAPEDVLRVESEARPGWLARYGGIETVDNITDDNVTTLARDRFDWSGLGREVVAPNEVIARLMRCGLDTGERRGFLGWLVERAAGVEDDSARATRAKYRRLARDLGVTLGTEAFSPGVVGHLDWETGEAVLRAA